MTRSQEKRDEGDLPHRARKQNLRKVLEAKSKPQLTKEPGDTSGLVVGVGPRLCHVFAGGQTRTLGCKFPVAPGDEVWIREDRVAGVAPRRTTLARTDPADRRRDRIIAANIDLLVIVASMENPPFRPGLVDRYLIAAARGGVQPVLCLNKTDLRGDTSAADIFRVPLVRCSAATGYGVEHLRDLLAGSVAVLVGQSGVGKSSLLNALVGGTPARTGAVSDDTGKGRHTTTSSRLYWLANGARIIDTPGIREFGLGQITLAELRTAFPEFDAGACRFRDCSHRDEPDCAIRDEGGARYASYLRLAMEL